MVKVNAAVRVTNLRSKDRPWSTWRPSNTKKPNDVTAPAAAAATVAAAAAAAASYPVELILPEDLYDDEGRASVVKEGDDESGNQGGGRGRGGSVAADDMRESVGRESVFGSTVTTGGAANSSTGGSFWSVLMQLFGRKFGGSYSNDSGVVLVTLAPLR